MYRHLKTLLLLLAFVTCTLQVHARLTASFTANQTSGCAPLVVNYTNTSTGATSYIWSLGNGNTSFFTNATGTYSTPGTYTVTLTATNNGGSVMSTMQVRNITKIKTIQCCTN